MGSQKRRDAGFWGLIVSPELFSIGDNNTLWKLNMNLVFHLSLLTHLRESLGNNAVYSQPFVSFPGCRLCFCLKLFLFLPSWMPWEAPCAVCRDLYAIKIYILNPWCSFLPVFSPGPFTHVFFHPWIWILTSKRSRSFLLFWFNRSTRLLLYLSVGPGSNEAEHVFSILKHANTVHYIWGTVQVNTDVTRAEKNLGF